MAIHGLIMISLAFGVKLQAEPAREIKQFEADTDTMSKEELKSYMGRGPDQELTPHLWRYQGNWTNSETLESFNVVNLGFGMKTDSHKYGLVHYTWDRE